MKRVAVINDLSGLGRCSLSAAISVLSVMGVQPCPVPTAVLSNQTGFPSYYLQDTTACLRASIDQWKALSVELEAICTGFLTGIEQVDTVESFCQAFRTPQTLLVVDPVMADDGCRYPSFSPELCHRITELALLADVVTPNLTEACLLTQTDYDRLVASSHRADYRQRLEELGEKINAAGVRTAVITGISHRDRVDNLVETEGHAYWVSSPKVGGSYSGTGDLLASVLCGGLCRGQTPEESVELAARFLTASLSDTVAEGIDRHEGVLFENHLSMLL